MRIGQIYLRDRKCPPTRQCSTDSLGRVRRFLSLIPRRVLPLRSTNERRYSTSRSHGARNCKENISALALDRRRIRRGRGYLGYTPPARVLPRVPARLHVLAGRRPWINGDPDDSPPDRRRLGHGHPSHSRRGNAHASFTGGSFFFCYFL